MKLAQVYRQNAAEALENARRVPDDVARREWINIAAHWTALAKARMDHVKVPPMLDAAPRSDGDQSSSAISRSNSGK